MVRPLVLVLLACTSACGGLDNRPLGTGAAEGQLTECDGQGFVGVVGDATVRKVPDAACRFRLDGLEPGVHELFVAPTVRKVVLVPVEVRATEVTDVGEVTGRPGAFLRVQVSAGGEIAGQVVAPDLPISATALGRSGFARIGPFPSGCFRLEVMVAGYPEQALTRCLSEGDEQDVEVSF